MFNTTKALILREVRYKEADRMLTLLTATDGKISAKARGALRKSSRTAAATQQLCYSELTLFGNRGKWTVNEGSIIEPFTGLQADITAFALGCYFAECVDALSVEDQPDDALMQLTLNSLYALSKDMYPQSHIKAAFEMRLMCISGYEPDLSGCSVCGRETPESALFDLEAGSIRCLKCAAESQGGTVPLSADSLRAMRYIVSAPAKQLFSFSLGEGALNELGRATERYLLAKTERRFGTLDYYKSLK